MLDHFNFVVFAFHITCHVFHIFVLLGFLLITLMDIVFEFVFDILLDIFVRSILWNSVFLTMVGDNGSLDGDSFLYP